MDPGDRIAPRKIGDGAGNPQADDLVASGPLLGRRVSARGEDRLFHISALELQEGKQGEQVDGRKRKVATDPPHKATCVDRKSGNPPFEIPN
jgi:hypothetical protein